jgi:hypothetical protein
VRDSVRASRVDPWLPGMEPWMLDDAAPWWAKLRRANVHRETLAALVAEFRAGEPYTLKPEQTNEPDVVAYRLRILREAPADISTVVGDVLHNLRSALDSLAHTLAEQSKGSELTSAETSATEFPICEMPDDYSRFFGEPKSFAEGKEPGNAQRLRGDIYDERARQAMRVVQSFRWAEMWEEVSDEERRRRYREEFEWSSIPRLRRMHNIDKHRRLPALAVGWPQMFWYSTNEGDQVGFRWGHLPFEDDTILCYLVGPQAAQTELRHDFALVLTDDPTHRPGDGEPYEPQDCLELLEGFAWSVDSKVRQVLSEYTTLGA